jgi:hypothetical protein
MTDHRRPRIARAFRGAWRLSNAPVGLYGLLLLLRGEIKPRAIAWARPGCFVIGGRELRGVVRGAFQPRFAGGKNVHW